MEDTPVCPTMFFSRTINQWSSCFHLLMKSVTQISTGFVFNFQFTLLVEVIIDLAIFKTAAKLLFFLEQTGKDDKVW